MQDGSAWGEAPDASVPPRLARRRQAILEAATPVFLKNGYLGTNMDEIAAVSGVSKQTVYKHFGSKEDLFIAIVSRLTDVTGDKVHDEMPSLESADVADYLETYALRQLSTVLSPQVMQLRRLVIGEVERFPDLARVLYERGPMRAMRELAASFERLTGRGLLAAPDPQMAAAHFNWLVMSDALNRAMLLGDDAIPDEAEMREQARDGVRVFLAAYGVRP